MIHNYISQPVTVSVELSTEGTVLLEDETRIEPNWFTRLDVGIDEKGIYDLTVAVDDREGGVTFDIEQYNLDTGSNIIVYPDDDDIRIGIEDQTYRDIEVVEVNIGW